MNLDERKKEFVVEIRFAKSSSMHYERALQIAEEFPGFSPLTKECSVNKVVAPVNDIKKRYRLLERLWDIVSGWKSAELLVAGEHREFYYLRSCFSIIDCEEQCSKSAIPEDFCSDGGEDWGCRHLHEIRTDNTPRSFDLFGGTHWYRFGEFVGDDKWKVKKTAIRSALEKEMLRKKIYLCDAFDFDRVDAALAELPAEVEITENGDWEVMYEDGKPIGIAPRQRQNQLPYSLLGGSFSLVDQSVETPKKEREVPETTFAEIGGLDNAIQAVREVIGLALRKPDLFKHLGIRPQRNVLLYGPSGCGKTLIAEAIANEVQAHLIVVNCPELTSSYLGHAATTLKQAFAEAKRLEPTILFLRNLDAIALKDKKTEHGSQLLHHLVSLMDALDDQQEIAITASVTELDSLDPIMLQAGRLDFQVAVEKPDKKGCAAILRIATCKMPVDEKLKIDKFSQQLVGLSGAEIVLVAREAAYQCLRRKLDVDKVLTKANDVDFSGIVVVASDFEQALQRVKKASGGKTKNAKSGLLTS